MYLGGAREYVGAFGVNFCMLHIFINFLDNFINFLNRLDLHAKLGEFSSMFIGSNLGSKWLEYNKKQSNYNRVFAL